MKFGQTIVKLLKLWALASGAAIALSIIDPADQIQQQLHDRHRYLLPRAVMGTMPIVFPTAGLIVRPMETVASRASMFSNTYLWGYPLPKNTVMESSVMTANRPQTMSASWIPTFNYSPQANMYAWYDTKKGQFSMVSSSGERVYIKLNPQTKDSVWAPVRLSSEPPTAADKDDFTYEHGGAGLKPGNPQFQNWMVCRWTYGNQLFWRTQSKERTASQLPPSCENVKIEIACIAGLPGGQIGRFSADIEEKCRSSSPAAFQIE